MIDKIKNFNKLPNWVMVILIGIITGIFVLGSPLYAINVLDAMCISIGYESYMAPTNIEEPFAYCVSNNNELIPVKIIKNEIYKIKSDYI